MKSKNNPTKSKESTRAKFKVVTTDDAVYCLRHLDADSQGGISGLQLDTIFAGLSEFNVPLENTHNISSDIPFYDDCFIDSCNPTIKEKNKHSYSFLPICSSQPNNEVDGFERIKTDSKLVFYKAQDTYPISEGVSVLSKEKTEAVLKFTNLLTNSCFSLIENHYHKVLVIKVLFSQFTKMNETQNKTLTAARENINKQLEQAINQRPQINTVFPLLDSFDIRKDHVKLDAILISNAFIRTFNQLNESQKNTILEIYEESYLEYVHS